jgi:hypothetical protein
MNVTSLLVDMPSLESSQKLLGELINLGKPASEAVTRRAIADQKYAQYLLMTKDIPELRDKLLLDPRNDAFQGEGGILNEDLAAGGQASDCQPGTSKLLSRATVSFVTWAKSGFKLADQNLLAKRLQACWVCEFLTDPPKTMIYQGVEVVTGKHEKICSACGCFVNKKAALATERCPKQDPDQTNKSRWGDTWIQNT